jgi:hypothetical protein
VGLKRLRKRFKALQLEGRIQCLLSESPVLGEKPGSLPPAFSISDGYTIYGSYRKSGPILDEAGFPLFTDEPVCDKHGHPIANSAGEFYAFDRGASRVLKLLGPRTIDRDFLQVARDAGHLLAAIPPGAFPVAIPPETLATDDSGQRWFYFLFDLAWAEVPGSPLQASLEKSAWHGNSTISLTALARVRAGEGKTHKALAAKFSHPLSWYSVIDDMVQASVDAIDILLYEAIRAPEQPTAEPAVVPTEKQAAQGATIQPEADSGPTGDGDLQPRVDTPPLPSSPSGGTVEIEPKRSTVRGEAQNKIISALTLHHEYQNGSCLNLKPIGNNQLARLAEVAKSTTSAFFKREFKGHVKYRAVCQDPAQLVAALKLLNQEFSPHHLYGSKPPGEGDREDEE